MRDTLAQQPSWPIPLVTASSGLLQVARTDFVRQIAPAGTNTWNYDNSKGVNVVPWYKVEFDALAPPYIQHNSAAKDGAGDFSMLLKYRLAAGNENHGNYSLSFSVAGTLPTGSYKMEVSRLRFLPRFARAKATGSSTCNRRWAPSCRRAIPRNWAASWCGTP